MSSRRLTLSQALGRAFSAYQAGKLVTAEKLYRQILSAKPDLFDAIHLLAITHASLGKNDLALAGYDRALGLKPNHVEALYNRGVTLQALKRHEAALASYDRALGVRPDHAETLTNRGVALYELKRYDEALASYDRGRAIRPNDVYALNNRGNALKELNRWEEALASYDRALGLQPDYSQALNNRGVVLHEMRRYEAALASYDRALSLQPDYAEAFTNRGLTLREMGRCEEALASYDCALRIQPDYADALSNRGVALYELKRHDEALASYERALAIKPDFDAALGELIHLRQHVCDWRNFDGDGERLKSLVAQGRHVEPFILRTADATPAAQLACARKCSEGLRRRPETAFSERRARSRGPIRIAYLSSDFRVHPVALSMAELIECHDRLRFEIFGYSLGPDDHSELRQRLERGFDRFVDLRGADDLAAAQRLGADAIDILVDLNGFTAGARTQILAYRPAPVQVSYLGYIGSMGADFIDYVMADSFAVPRDRQPFYGEKIVHLPGCYLPVDQTCRAATETLSRHDYGLPETGFVFSCVSNSYKLTPGIFGVWMRLLDATPGSVLWLYESHPLVKSNLRREASLRGVDPDRMIFAPRIPFPQYLARLRRADLFLDTIPCSACTTACDALWAGLPVVTLAGPTFTGRHAGSLLTALGLPELITYSLPEYEALAFHLAASPRSLDELRQRLRRNRRTAPLFDMRSFARNLEAAYRRMWEIWLAGEKPEPFSIDAGHQAVSC